MLSPDTNIAVFLRSPSAEPVVSSILSYVDSVVPEGRGPDLIATAIQAARDSTGYDSAFDGTVQNLLEVRPVSATQDVTKLSVRAENIHTRPNFIETALEGEAEYSTNDIGDRRNLIAGRIFHAMESAKLSPTWTQALNAFDSYYSIEPAPRPEALETIALSESGLEVKAALDEVARVRFEEIRTQLGIQSSAGNLLSRIADKFPMRCVDRGVKLDDAGPNAVVKRDSHILRESVVTQLSIETSGERPHVVGGKIYLRNPHSPVLRSEIAHEILETAIFDSVLLRTPGGDFPKLNFAQYFAELKASDILVWCAEHKLVGKEIGTEDIAILDRAFIVLFGADSICDKLARMGGPENPILREFATYGGLFFQMLRRADPADFRPATKELEQRTTAEQARFGRFLVPFFDAYLSLVDQLARSNPGKFILGELDQLVPGN